MNLKLCLIVVGLLGLFALSDARNCNKKRSQARNKIEENEDIDDDDVGSYRFLTGTATSNAALNNFLDQKQALIDRLRPTTSNAAATTTGIITGTTGISTGSGTVGNTNTNTNSIAGAVLPQILGNVVANGRRPNNQRRRRRRRRPNNNGNRVYVVRAPSMG